MRLLFLSKYMAAYTGAMYQQDVMDEVQRQENVVFYGPGFDGFDPELALTAFLKGQEHFDAVIVGHSWLRDGGGPVDSFPNLGIGDVSIPKFCILNKEYASLPEKLKWIRESGIAAAFTHHHDWAEYSRITDVPFTFWPFAVNGRIFKNSVGPFSKKIDFSFSGILQNQTPENGQSDVRLKVMRDLHHCVADIPVMKKAKYRDIKVAWNSAPRGALQRGFATLIGNYKFQSKSSYVHFLRASKIVLNTISPVGLVSPRYAESMASGALVMTEKSNNVQAVFPANLVVTFEPDLSDFENKLRYFLFNDEARLQITEPAFEHVHRHHTWEIRVRQLLQVVRSHL